MIAHIEGVGGYVHNLKRLLYFLAYKSNISTASRWKVLSYRGAVLHLTPIGSVSGCHVIVSPLLRRVLCSIMPDRVAILELEKITCRLSQL